MAYWRLYYHFVWTTKARVPWISEEIEAPLYRFLYDQAKEFYCPFFYIGGIAEHIHILTAVRPSVSPADFMKQLKGSSSRFVTQEFGGAFEWQQGYGVFSLAQDAIDSVKAYVLNQKLHHANRTLFDAWEETDNWNLGPETSE